MATGLRLSADTPLHEHSVLRSDSIDEVRAFLGVKDIDIRPAQRIPGDARCKAAIDGVYLPRMYIGYMEYGVGMEMSALEPLDADYAVHVPLGGWIDLHTGRHTVRCKAGHAAVVSPANRNSLTTSDGCGRLLVSIRPDPLRKHLAAMLGEPPAERLAFTPDVDPSRLSGRRLANAVHYAAQEFEPKASVDANPLVVAQFEQFLMTLLLMEQPNNYSEALRNGVNRVRPRDVKKAIDYIHANLGQAIGLADLVAVSSVPARTLYHHFRNFVGTTPMGYVKQARLDRVRDELEKLAGDGSVTEIAGRWGFGHMGRFSAAYRHRFGELPSVTAGRRRPTED